MTAKFKSMSWGKKTLIGIGSFVVLSGVFGALAPPEQKPLDVQKTAPAANVQAENKTEVKRIEEVVQIPFQSIIEDDPTLTSGTSRIVTNGVQGQKTVTYEATFSNGAEINRKQIAERISLQPINEVRKNGTKVSTSSCSHGYVNSAGNCIPSPSSNPAGATAQCQDGTYSYSQSRRGTCSHHGGVATWY